MVSEHPSIEIHQALFGYQDGHRLLATSIPLDDDSASTVLTLSDLAAASSDVGMGYWTGIPLVKAKTYALIRTWLAPEMPRPGCVWSHVLLIKFSDLGRIRDLAVVAQLAAYPHWPLSLQTYEAPLLMGLGGIEASGGVNFTRDHALNVLRNAYARRPGNVLGLSRAVIEEVTFSIWSQQWPRLRRAFAFRTTGQGTFASSTRQLMAGGMVAGMEGVAGSEALEWETAAIDDLFDQQGGAFRQFIWRYGSDVRHSRERFKLLAETFVSLQSKPLSGPRLQSVLKSLTNELPDHCRREASEAASRFSRSSTFLPGAAV